MKLAIVLCDRERANQSELDGSQPMMVSSGSAIDLKLHQPPLCWLPELPPLLRDARYLRTG